MQQGRMGMTTLACRPRILTALAIAVSVGLLVLTDGASAEDKKVSGTAKFGPMLSQTMLPRLPPHSSGKPNIASLHNDIDPGTRAREPHQRESAKWGNPENGEPQTLLTATIYTWRARVRDKVGTGPAWRI